MPHIPRDGNLNSTLALLADGYEFVGKRCRRHQSDIFATRLALRKAVCITGEEAARAFYEPGRFTRRGALPPTALLLLQDKGSVATLDGAAHRHRKAMFLSLMTAAAVDRLADIMAEEWHMRLERWARRDAVVLHDGSRAILTRAICRWASIPLAAGEAGRRTREFGAMIDGAGSVGPRNWRGLLLRARTERWARGVIARARSGELAPPPGSALHTIAWHREADGALLDAAVAAVELLNVLRPTVAIDRYITFAALALHEHPAWRQRLADGDDEILQCFAQEVRRFYPFFPLVAGRALRAFDWRGHHFVAGSWVLLDLYGTNHDARTWEDPGAFRPERFRQWDGSAFNFIPQGGGDHETGHRCPGEWITIALIKRALRLLTTAMRYDVPEQDLRIDLARLPAIPRSRFVITNVRPTN